MDTLTFGLAVTAVFLVAGWVKGVAGMGLPTVAMGVLGLLMPPVQAAALLVVPSLVTNIWQALVGGALRHVWLRIWRLLAGVVAGTALGIGFLTQGANHAPAFALGAVLAAYAVFGLARPALSVPPRHEPWLSPLIGLATGVLSGATGVFVVPAVPYLSALGFSKEALIQALGLSFTVSTLALAAGLAFSGSYPSSLALGSLFAVLPTMAGMFIGQALRDRLSPEVFRHWFFVMMLLIGVAMCARAGWGLLAGH